MGATFLQPSWPVASWSRGRYDVELADMSVVGIRTVILQWTVDMDAKIAWFPASLSGYRRNADMVGLLMAAAARRHDSVWLGLGNVYSWQKHASDRRWLANQLAIDERIADQLWARHHGSIAGWYISNEVDDALLSRPSTASTIGWFFSQLTHYLHTHDGGRPVMTSPTYSGLHLSTTQFAAAAQRYLHSVNVLNVQDGGGSGYIAAGDIKNWFTALHKVFAGSPVQLWQDPDMYGLHGPMASAQLQRNLAATCGLVNMRSGFSFTTQMGPHDLRTSSYYNAYRAFRSGVLAHH